LKDPSLSSASATALPYRRLVVVDSYSIVAEGIASLVGEHFEQVSVATTAQSLRVSLSLGAEALVLADLYVAGTSCVSLMREMLKKGTNAAFVFLPAEATAAVAAQAMEAGAKAFLHRRCPVQELERAIAAVQTGCTYVAASLIATREDLARQRPSLTTKQQLVLKLVAGGRSAPDIAEALHLSLRTVESHKRAIMRQLGVHSVAAMLDVAKNEGLLGSS